VERRLGHKLIGSSMSLSGGSVATKSTRSPHRALHD
jgi:hypothetical protein